MKRMNLHKGENNGRCRGKQVIYEEDEKNRRDDRALRYT